jgi:hypothetical protein
LGQGFQEGQAIVALAAGNEALLVWMFAFTGAASVGLLGFVVTKCKGFGGVEQWLNSISDKDRATHKQSVVHDGYHLYVLHAERESAKNAGGAQSADSAQDEEIETAAANWLSAIGGWLDYEAVRQTRVKKSAFLKYALPLHVAAVVVSLILHQAKLAAYFPYAALTAVISLAASIFVVGPLLSLAMHHGTPGG